MRTREDFDFTKLPPFLTAEEIETGVIQRARQIEIDDKFKYTANIIIDEIRYRVSFFADDELTEEQLKVQIFRELLQKRKVIIPEAPSVVSVNIDSLNGQSLSNPD